MKKIYLLIFVLMCSQVYSQGEINGKVLDNTAKTPIPNIKVKLIAPIYSRETTTNDKGEYTFANLNNGYYTISVSQEGFFEASTYVDYIKGETVTAEDILVEKIQEGAVDMSNLPVFEQVDDESSTSDGGSVSSLINSSRDVFAFNAFMSWFQGRFNYRGTRGQDQMFLLNGLPLEEINSGNQVTYSDYTGLNDIMRSRNNYYGIKAVPFSFGEMTSSVNVDAEAINQSKGLRINQTLSNRTFVSRTAVTYNTGLLKNSFAISASASFRGGNEGFSEGTASQVLSGYLSVSKKWNEHFHSSLSIIGTDNERALSKASTKEFYQLAGSNYYNPNWGEYNGYKRSINIKRDNAPLIVFSNKFDLNNKTKINFSLGYQFGQRYREKIDWYNSYSPDPSYYRNAPSYFIDNPDLYNEMYNKIVDNPSLLQVDWQRIYDANTSNVESVPNTTTTGKWARYVMYKDVNNLSNILLNSTITHQLNETVMLNGGIMAQLNNAEYYKEISDLLGADFFVNINQFAQRSNPSDPDAIQNDLNNPNQIVKVGDKYGYNYKTKATNLTAWGQGVFTFDKLDAFASLRLENTSYQRNGLYNNGAYKELSFGESPTVSFTNLSAKGGVTYKVNGKNYISFNVLRANSAPLFQQVFVLNRTTNIISDKAQSKTTTSGELTYSFRGPIVKATLTGFYIQTENESDVRNFYTELSNSFGALVINNMDKRNIGIEAAAETKIANTGFSVLGVANIGDYIFSNRPNFTFYYDNFYQINPEEKLYFQNLHLPTGPQLTTSLKVTYNSKQYWMASLGVNYFDKIYIDPSPQRRTVSAIDNVDPSSKLYSSILTQERMPSAITVDAFFRKSFLLNKYIKSLKTRMFFDINFSVSNILDNTNFVTSGYEQLRFDFKDKNPEKYPNRYYYAFGRTYSLNLVFRL